MLSCIILEYKIIYDIIQHIEGNIHIFIKDIKRINNYIVMFRPILIPAISHGITDIVDAPKQTIFTYALVCPLVYHFPLKVKIGLLLCGSVYHLRKDMPGFRDNVLMHILWIQYPIIAELYLSFIHTPRHYYRTLFLDSYRFKYKILCIGLMTIASIVDMIFKYSDQLTHLWWVGPALAHIYMTDFYIPSRNCII